MLDKWKIPLSKVHVILRDNASNMKRAMNIMGVRSLGCVAHTMQLVLNEGLLSQRSVSDAIAGGRHILGILNILLLHISGCKISSSR